MVSPRLQFFRERYVLRPASIAAGVAQVLADGFVRQPRVRLSHKGFGLGRRPTNAP